jgi:glycosyltransferase involved in cell wall biosynthesis
VHRNKIAFYAPLKSPEHEVPSGDRLMARSLVECLQQFGYRVEIVSQFRALIRDPNDETANTSVVENADRERERILTLWKRQGPPDCWFCYHPYYKSPDLLGPALCQEYNLPYVTAEASYSKRRNQGFWGFAQERVLDAVNAAAMNLYFTQRDKVGLRQGSHSANLARLRPFIHPLECLVRTCDTEPLNLVTVAMMRPGDKWNSYVRLAAALSKLSDVPWTLHIVGDGSESQQVHALFDNISSKKVVWHGEKTSEEIAAIYADGAIYVWPGCGEAYGLAYLEAQSAGLPVVAFDTAGVPEVVDNGYSGILIEEGDDNAYAEAIRHLLTNVEERRLMSANARQHIVKKHAFKQASDSLGKILQQVIGAAT